MLAARNYLIVGTTENWEAAFHPNPPVWGFTERERTSWEAIAPNDTIYLYAAGKARGVIGKGVVLNKFLGRDLRWPKEVEKGAPKWTLRFYFRPTRLLPPARWRSGRGPVPCSEIGIPGVHLQGKQILPLNVEQAASLEMAMASWDEVAVGSPPLPEPLVSRETAGGSYRADMASPEAGEVSAHTKLLRMIEEMGTMQNFIAQTEFTIPNETRRVDVVWKMEVRGAPTYAFEVELSSGFDRALNKLNQCYRLWRTLPRLIVPEEEKGKVNQIVAPFSSEFRRSCVTVSPIQIEELYRKKKDYRTLEQTLGLL